jgi:hypothetical protein
MRDYFPGFADLALLATVFLIPLVGAIVFPLWLLAERKNGDAFLSWMFTGVTIASTVASAVWALTLHPGESLPSAAVRSSVAAATVAVGLIPLWAMSRAVRFLFTRHLSRVVVHAAVPVLAIALFLTGQPAADLIATSVYGPSLQTRAARDDASFAMTETYDSVFGAVTYIVLDSSESDISLVERRFDAISQTCATRARRIGAHYYLVGGVSDPC